MVAQEAIVADFLQTYGGTLLPAPVPCVASFPFVLFPCVQVSMPYAGLGWMLARITGPRDAFFHQHSTKKNVLGNDGVCRGI